MCECLFLYDLLLRFFSQDCWNLISGDCHICVHISCIIHGMCTPQIQQSIYGFHGDKKYIIALNEAIEFPKHSAISWWSITCLWTCFLFKSYLVQGITETWNILQYSAYKMTVYTDNVSYQYYILIDEWLKKNIHYFIDAHKNLSLLI